MSGFPWWHAARPKRDSQKREAMYRQDLEQQASLLLRLGRTPKQVKARLSANVSWEFDLHNKPKHLAEIDKIVDAAARRHDA
jgi:hypothetical protein